MDHWILKAASRNPQLRRTLILKLAEEEKKNFLGRWKQYLKEKWDGGKKTIPNPDRDGAKKDVTIETAMKKDEPTKKKVLNDYKKWKEEQEQGGGEKKSKPVFLARDTQIKVTGLSNSVKFLEGDKFKNMSEGKKDAEIDGIIGQFEEAKNYFSKLKNPQQKKEAERQMKILEKKFRSSLESKK